ncbi:MAG: hypothetical protein V4439_01100 [Patescibacteria group bacterium]
MVSNILDRISFWALFAVITLLPIFFLPFTSVPIETSKGLLLIVGLSLSIIFWAAARFSDGKIILPKSRILVAGLGIVLAFLISALFSPVMKVSFFGAMLDTGTFYFMLSAFLLMLASALVMKSERNTRMIVLGTLASFAVLFVFQILRLFMPQTFALGVLGAKTDNILGSWNALGMFAGFGAVTSLFSLEFFELGKEFKILLGSLLVLALFLIAAVNFSLVWAILGVFSLFIFVYKVSFSGKVHREGEPRSFPLVSFAVAMLSIVFFMSGNFLGAYLPNSLGVSNLEIRPSFTATMMVSRDVLAHNPVLGAGPNRFPEMWAMHKPLVVNATNFWDSYFDSGMGVLPTFIITTGGLGIISFLIFFVLFFIAGVKCLFYSPKNNAVNSTSMLLFFSAFYLFVASFFYSTGPAIFLLAFAFTGAFIGVFWSNKTNGYATFSFLDDPRKSFFSILLLVIIMAVCVAVGFKYIERFASVAYFQKTFSAQSVDEAELNINKALALVSNDLYLRAYSQVYIAKMNSLVAKGASLSETEKADLRSSFENAVSGAQSAITYDKTNYLNYNALGGVYEVVAPLGVDGAYDKAFEAYKNASDLNPFNPGLKLSLARVSFANKKVQDAKDYANQALTLKPDYLDALIVLSQLARGEGNMNDALSYAESALSVAPQSQQLIEYVNSLKNLVSISAVPPTITNVTKTTAKKK